LRTTLQNELNVTGDKVTPILWRSCEQNMVSEFSRRLERLHYLLHLHAGEVSRAGLLRVAIDAHEKAGS